MSNTEDNNPLFVYIASILLPRVTKVCLSLVVDPKNLSKLSREHQYSMEHLWSAINYGAFGNVNIAAHLEE